MNKAYHFAAVFLFLLGLNTAALAAESVPAANSPATANNQAAPATAQPAKPTEATITGTVQATQAAPAVATINPADYLDILVKAGDAKPKFQEFSVTVNNKQAKHIELLQLEVTNGVSEQAYLQIQQSSSQAKRKLAGGLLRGITGVATSFVPYAGIGSMAAYQAIGAGNTAVNAAANMIQDSSGAMQYSGKVVQRVGNILISPNQQFQCLAVVPEKQQPIVKIIFKDLQSNQIYDLQK
jgi:hypothetical protein